MHYINTTTTNPPSTSWSLRIAGYFWIVVGLIEAIGFLIGPRGAFANDEIRNTLLLLSACFVFICLGYGLSRAKLWGKIGGAILGPLMALVFLDMALMVAVHHHYILFWLGIAGVLMSIYTLIVIVVVRR